MSVKRKSHSIEQTALVNDMQTAWNAAYGEIERLKTENALALAALIKLIAEASGFLSMADPQAHGITNMNVLQMRLAEAKAAVTRITKDDPNPLLSCGHCRFDTSFACITCLQFTVNTLNAKVSRLMQEATICGHDAVDPDAADNFRQLFERWANEHELSTERITNPKWKEFDYADIAAETHWSCWKTAIRESVKARGNQ